MFYKILKTLVLPPTSFFVLFFAGWLLTRWRPRLGRALLWSLLAVVYLATTPFVAGELMAPLQPYGPVELDNLAPEAGAIVILSAGVYHRPPEYQQPGGLASDVDAAGSLTLQRLQYGAFLSKASGKPILVTGGPVSNAPERTIANAMRHALEQDFGVPVRWVEDRADSTRTNAEYSSAMLRGEGIDTIYLVTHAWHMPRALIAFEGSGLKVLPAPTRFYSRADPLWGDFVPSVQALRATSYAVHEWIGIAWYRLRS